MKKIATFNVSFRCRPFFQALSNTGSKQAPGITLMHSCFMLYLVGTVFTATA